MPHEQAPKVQEPETIFTDSRVERFSGVLPDETVGLGRESVTQARDGLKILTSGIEAAGLGDSFKKEHDVLRHVQLSGNEVLEQITSQQVSSTMGRLKEDRYEEDGYYGNFDKEKDEERLKESAARAKAFKRLSEAVVSALDDDPVVVQKQAPVYVDYEAQGPGGGGDKVHAIGYKAAMDAVEMMSEVVNGGFKRADSSRGYIETSWTGQKGHILAYDEHYFEDGPKLIITEVPLPKLGVSIIVRETVPKYITDKNSPRVETFVVSTVEAEKRRLHVGARMEGRSSGHEKQIFDPKEAKKAGIRYDEARRRELDEYRQRERERQVGSKALM